MCREGLGRGVVTTGRETPAGLLTITRGGVSGVLIWRGSCRLPWVRENVGKVSSPLCRSNPAGILLEDFNSFLSVISQCFLFPSFAWFAGTSARSSATWLWTLSAFCLGDPSFSKTFLLSRSLVASEHGGLWTGLAVEGVLFFI